MEASCRGDQQKDTARHALPGNSDLKQPMQPGVTAGCSTRVCQCNKDSSLYGTEPPSCRSTARPWCKAMPPALVLPASRAAPSCRQRLQRAGGTSRAAPVMDCQSRPPPLARRTVPSLPLQVRCQLRPQFGQNERESFSTKTFSVYCVSDHPVERHRQTPSARLVAGSGCKTLLTASDSVMTQSRHAACAPPAMRLAFMKDILTPYNPDLQNRMS